VDSRFNWLVSVALLVLFAYMSTYFPDHLSTFMLIYIFAMLAVTFAIAGRSARAIFRDLEYVRTGKLLLSVSSEEIAKLKTKDRDLNREMNEQVRATLPQLLAPFVFMLVLLVPAARESALQSLGSLLRPLSLSANAQRFLTFLLFYGLLTLVLYTITYASGKYLEHIGGRLEIPSFYLVTDRGLILEGRTPIKAPIKALGMKVDTRRKFIELRVKTHVSVGGGASRVRLYCEDPRKLEAYLKALSEERS
jgi:uncharacterized membrane protein